MTETSPSPAPAVESAEATRRLAYASNQTTPCPHCGSKSQREKGGTRLCDGCDAVLATVDIQPPSEPAILVVRR